MGQVMAVISGKGGTGKTSLCAGICACLAAEGCSVLAIDCDVGLRNLDISLGMADRAVLPFTSVMDGTYRLDDATPSPDIPGLRLLTAPVTLEPEELDVDQFGQLLAQAREQFDWCLIDAPAGVGAGFRLAVRHADRALVVSTGDPAALRDAAHAASLLELAGVRQMHLAVNRVSGRLFEKMQATIDDVMDEIGLPLLGIVPEDVNVTLAAAEGKPLILHTNRGAAVACLHLARRLCGKKVPLMKCK